MTAQKIIICIVLVFSSFVPVCGMEAPERRSRILSSAVLAVKLNAIEQKFGVGKSLKNDAVRDSLQVLRNVMRCKGEYGLQKQALALYGKLVSFECDHAWGPAFQAMMQALTDDAYVDSDFVEDLFDIVAPKMVKDQPDVVLKWLRDPYLSKYMVGFQLSMFKALVKEHQQDKSSQNTKRNTAIAHMLRSIVLRWEHGDFSADDVPLLFIDMVELAVLLRGAQRSSNLFESRTLPSLKMHAQALLQRGEKFSEAVMEALRSLEGECAY